MEKLENLANYVCEELRRDGINAFMEGVSVDELKEHSDDFVILKPQKLTIRATVNLDDDATGFGCDMYIDVDVFCNRSSDDNFDLDCKIYQSMQKTYHDVDLIGNSHDISRKWVKHTMRIKVENVSFVQIY